jgi:hypothetical protein
MSGFLIVSHGSFIATLKSLLRLVEDRRAWSYMHAETYFQIAALF